MRRWMGLLPIAALLPASCTVANTPEACQVVHIADIPIRLVGTLPLVDAAIDGKPVRLLIDTGADSLLIKQELADRLALDRDYTRAIYSTGLGAQTSNWPTKPVPVQLGPVTLPAMSLGVATPGAMGSDRPRASRFDGVVGGQVLSAYDVDIDMPNRRLGLYRRRTCTVGPPPFGGPSITLPTSQAGPYRVIVPVAVDDAPLRLEIDTGASRTLLDARAVGLAGPALEADRPIHLVTADPVGQTGHLHRFGSLQIGSDRVAGPLLLVAQVQQPAFSGLLGSDYWRSHRLWLSYGSQTITVGLPPG